MKKNLLLFLVSVFFILSVNAQQFLHRAVPDGRVDSVWTGHTLPHSFSGKDIIIGFTDWGFDYTHPVFYDTLMDQYRVLKVWDQYKQGGPAPSGYNYGTEISGKEALLSEGCDTSNVYGYNYHGTHVASIAAGGGAGTQYKGVAFDADLLFVSILVDEQAIIDAFCWMHKVSLEEQKRLVINMSWGLYYMGNMDGTGRIANVVDSLSNLGVVFVSSAGNNGDVNFHLHHHFEGDTLKSWIKYAGGSDKQWGQSVSMLSSPESPFSFALQILDNTNQPVANSPFFYTAAGDTIIEDFLLLTPVDTFFYKIVIEKANFYNARPQVRMIIKKMPAAGYKAILSVSAETGDFHAWNLIELVNGVGNWGGEFAVLPDSPDSKNGDSNYGIGAPGNIQSVITVAAHRASFIPPSGIPVGGEIANFSSFGTTIDHREKPEISAPGNNVVGALSSFSDQYAGLIAQTIYFNEKTYRFVSLSGTSMSSPFVAGVAALVLQANPGLSSEQVKHIILSTAYQDQHTETHGAERFGSGKVDAYAAVKKALEIVDVPIFPVEKMRVTFYPNPSSDVVYLSFSGSGHNITLELFDFHGRLLYKQKVEESVHKVNIQHLSPGCYFIRITDKKNQEVHKLIKN